jgi:hypothetical protein
MNNRGIGFIQIEASALSETLSYKSSFEFVDTPVCESFHLEYPFSTNFLSSFNLVHYIPSPSPI